MSALPLPAGPEALCAHLPGDWWDDDEVDPVAEVAAKKVCRQCPLVVACRAYGLSLEPEQNVGVWGGLSADDRRWIDRRALTVADAAGRVGLSEWDLSRRILTGRGPLTARHRGRRRVFRGDLAWWAEREGLRYAS